MARAAKGTASGERKTQVSHGQKTWLFYNCLFIPHAPIPSASGLRLGFGYLNPLLKGYLEQGITGVDGKKAPHITFR